MIALISVKLLFSNIRGDIFGGVTAAIVALPLALAFGVISGAGPQAGLYGAIAIGFFSALFGGTPAQVSGPTGPLTVVMAGVIATYQHDLAMAFTVVMIAGLFLILFGTLRLGRYIAYMPYPVISGFMSGVGVIIIILQLAPGLGHDATGGNVIQVLASLPEYAGGPIWNALVLTVITLSIIVAIPARLRLFIPPPLAGLVVGTLAGLFLFTGTPTIGEIPTGLPEIVLPSFTLEALPGMISAGLTLAILSAIDSLLVSLVADTFTKTRHNSNRELIGQGIGSLASGLVGGIAGSGAAMRTVINIRAGGRTRLSGIIHALVLVSCLLGLGFLVQDIPKAVLAGILLKVGFDIIDWDFLKRLRHAGIRHADRNGLTVMLTVLVLTVFVDLITAVAVGIIMKSLITARKLSQHQIDSVQMIHNNADKRLTNLVPEEQELLERAGNDLLLLRFTGPLSFGTAHDLTGRLESVTTSYKTIIFDLSSIRMMDVSIMMAMKEMINDFMGAGCRVLIAGTESSAYTMMDKHKVLEKISPDHCFSDTLSALKAVGTKVY